MVPASPLRAGLAALATTVWLLGCSDQPVGTAPSLAQGGAGKGPTVRETDPSSAPRGITLDVRVLGSGYDQGSGAVWALQGDTAFATTRVRTNSTTFVSSSELRANITIESDASLALYDVVVVTKGGKRGIGIEKFEVTTRLTLYRVTLASGLLADLTHPFATQARTGDPFAGAVGGYPVYLTVPASSAGNAAVCDADGSGLGATTTNWSGYAGIWKGDFSISAKGGKYHFSYRGAREDGSGLLYLVVNGPAVKSNGNLTLTFTNARGLVSAYSTPDGGPFDPQDRCLTFSIVATP